MEDGLWGLGVCRRAKRLAYRGAAEAELPFQSGASTVTLPEIDLAQGEAQLHAWIEVDGSRHGVRYVEVTRRD